MLKDIAHRSSGPVGWIGLSAAFALAVTGLAHVMAPSSAVVPPWWPLAGLGFALLSTRVPGALWGLGLGAGAGVLITQWGGAPWPWWPAVVVALGLVVSQAWAWRRLKLVFAGTSQPFARQTTMLAFLRIQGLEAAPLFALVLAAGSALGQGLGWGLTPPAHPGGQLAGWAWQGLIHGVFMLCGAVLVAPLSWEALVSRTRDGPSAFGRKFMDTVLASSRTLLGASLIMAAALALWGARQPVAAGAAMWLLLPLLATDALRAAPRTTHTLLLLVGFGALTAGGWGLSAVEGLERVQGNAHGLALGLTLAISAMGVQLLQATAHERRLALRRLERQADTDPVTNLLSVTGLYRQLEDWGDRVDAPPDTQFGGDDAPPVGHRLAVVSVQMTNAESLQHILGARKSDQLERSVSGALAQTAPRVKWARISKLHFVGLIATAPDDLNDLLNQLNFAVLESRSLVDDQVARPLWALAAVRIETQPIPPVEVVMACLRQAEQQAQESRQTQVLPVNRESGVALKLEAEQAERIRQHIQNRQLVLFAQPIVANVHPESMPHKYEILVRLRDDQGQIVPPGLWLPIAMRAGLMQMLDLAVMEQTFEWFAAHPQALAALSHCAINLSGPTVASPVVADRIAQGLKHHRLPADKFTFEITESQAIANPGQATDTIRAIRACGCRVAIDDFGTGVATFDYLKRFDVDYIKIDGAFIRSLLTDPVDRVIVESIVKVARELGVRTVAEFVSSAELHQAVTDLGVDESQGFAFGQPRGLGEWFDERV